MLRAILISLVWSSFAFANTSYAQMSNAIRDLANRDASSLELGLLKLETFLSRAQNTVLRELPPGFSAIISSPAFNQQDGSLLISFVLSANETLTIDNQDCSKGVQTVRNILRDPSQSISDLPAQTIVGLALIPVLIENQSRYQSYIQAAREIESRTRIRSRIVIPGREISCEGLLMSEDTVFFQ